MQETQGTRVRALDQEDAVQKDMATHSSILGWRIPWKEEPGGLHPQGHKELGTTDRLTLSLSTFDYLA